MSRSLHLNAERLINDVANTHRAFVEQLEKARPAGAPVRATPRGDAELGIPEFVPESPRGPRPPDRLSDSPGVDSEASRSGSETDRALKPDTGTGERRGRWRAR
ncbi:MAG: hypothetical protein M3P40_08135 [Actinomycetota bacterium]|nr:hypothetical protein [Actinomycetota bacterium]